MAKKLSQLIDKIPAPAVMRAQAKEQAMHAEMPLNELLQARGLSQKMLADVLHFSSPPLPRSKSEQICTFPPYAATSRQWAVSARSLHGFPIAM